MAMVMGVEVGRIATDDRSKAFELLGDVVRHQSAEPSARPDERPWPPPDAPVAKLDVQPHRKVRVPAGVVCCVDRGRTIDHEARARDDAAFVRFDYPTCDAAAIPEVVRIDDQQPQGSPL